MTVITPWSTLIHKTVRYNLSHTDAISIHKTLHYSSSHTDAISIHKPLRYESYYTVMRHRFTVHAYFSVSVF